MSPPPLRQVRMPLHELRCEMGAEPEKPNFSLHFGGMHYVGSCASRPDAELLVMRVQARREMV